MYEDFFSQRLSSLRIQKGVSAREMSLAIGQNGSYINRIENKKAFPSMQCFFYICEYLEITPTEFFDYNISNPLILNELNKILYSLDSAQLDIILSVAKGLQPKKSER